jgi:hypothetical protein
MSLDFVNQVWVAMLDGEYYSARDLANHLDSSVEKVERVVKFLMRYGFVSEICRNQPLFKRVSGVMPPSEAKTVLKILLDSAMLPRSSHHSEDTQGCGR